MAPTADDDARRERAMGELLADARRTAGLSIRRAAKVSGIPQLLWADMERGERSDGGRVGADDRTVGRAAAAVGIDAAGLFGALGRTPTPEATPVPVGLAATVAQLEARLRRTEAALALLAERVGVTPDELRDAADPDR